MQILPAAFFYPARDGQDVYLTHCRVGSCLVNRKLLYWNVREANDGRSETEVLGCRQAPGHLTGPCGLCRSMQDQSTGKPDSVRMDDWRL